MSEAALIPKDSRRLAEQQLDAAASPLDLQTDIGFRETLAVIWRALTYLKYVKARFALKCFFVGLALLTPLVMPWPIKVVIDNVILGQPVNPAAFPAYFAPFVEFLDGRSAVEMMLWVIALGASMVIVFGGFGAGGGASDETEGGLTQGHDTATQTENEANMAHSKFAGLIGFVEFRLQLRLTQALNHLLRAQLFERIQRLPMAMLSDQRISDSLYRIMYDTPAISNVFYQVIMSPPLSVFSSIVVLYVMATTYGDAPEIIWLAVLIVPVQCLAIWPFPRMMRRRSQASRAAGSATTGNIEEGMSNILAVQSLGGNNRERERFHKASAESFKRYRAQVLVNILLGIARAVGRGGLGFLAFYVISSRVIDGMLTPGDYGVLFYYYAWLAGSLGYLPYIWFRVQHSVPGIRRVFFLMDLPGEAGREGISLTGIREQVEMHGVGYVYPDGRRALADVDLTARVGEITALVGPTGAGKTSLALLLPGLHEPTEGTIRIDGVNVNDISLTSLRQQVSYVFQETQLFSDSIMDNIRYGCKGALQQDVERVARIAGAHEFISALPDGYDTLLGTVTSKLSVGQKQRIAIARGLLKDASILILDEPTSALDPETEAYLVSALREAARNKLVFVIAHRLSTIANADRIVFLDDGRILEAGSHSELMAKPDGHYRDFVTIQSATA